MTRRLDLPDTSALAEGAGVRRSAPSAERNAAPILAQLRRLAPPAARVLELASGTGQHAAAFAGALSGLDWQPSDVDPAAFASILAWTEGMANVRPPVRIDAGAPHWAQSHRGHALVLVVNLLHLVSASEARNAVAGFGTALAPGGLALVYGPFRRDGRLTSDGDAAFDASLRAQDSAIGYKDVAEVDAWAAEGGLVPAERIEMPANNLLLVYRRMDPNVDLGA